MATKAAEQAVGEGNVCVDGSTAGGGLVRARPTRLGWRGPLGSDQVGPWGPGGAGLESAEGRLSQLNQDGEQRLPVRGGQRERSAAVGAAVCGAGRLFELAEGSPAAAGVGCQFAEEGVQFILKEHGQQPTEAAFRGACVPGDPTLARLLLTLGERQEPLSPALGRLGRDTVQGAEGPIAGVLLAKCLAQPQCDLGLGCQGRVAGERVGVAGSGRAGFISDLAGPLEGETAVCWA